jgi:hypothetical protein
MRATAVAIGTALAPPSGTAAALRHAVRRDGRVRGARTGDVFVHRLAAAAGCAEARERRAAQDATHVDSTAYGLVGRIA